MAERPEDRAPAPQIPPDAPEADLLDQAREVDGAAADSDRPSIPIDAPEADVLDQSREAPLEDER